MHRLNSTRRKPDISFCIPTLNRVDCLKRCIESIKKSDGLFTYEIVIADGGSTDGTIEYLEENDIDYIPDVVGSVNAVNVCLKRAESSLLININDDMVVVPSTIKKCITLFKQDSSLGLIAPKMIETKYNKYPNVQVDKSGLVVSKIYIVRKSVLEDMGYNDSNYDKYLIDIDLFFSVIFKGYRTCVSKDVGIIHHRSDLGRTYDVRDKIYFNNKWKHVKTTRRNIYFYLRRCMHFRLLQFLMNKQNRYFISMYDFLLDRCSRFRYEGYKHFYLFQKNRRTVKGVVKGK